MTGRDRTRLDRSQLGHSRPDRSQLGPPRDTGLVIEGRAARDRRRKARRRRQRALAALLVCAALVLGGWLIVRSFSSTAGEGDSAGRTTPTVARAMDAPAPEREPTPIFATYGNIELRVPVPSEDLVDIAFHQASFSYATHLKTKLPTASTDSAANKHGTGRTTATSVANEQGWLTGSVLRLWRTRPGKPDSAADVGAPAGSPVLAPVSGTVLLVKPYKLYSKYDDFEVHIRPDGHDDLDAVLIHVTDPQVKAGDVVKSGVTQVGAVRKLSDKMHLQLSDFVPGAGDHTHVQLNRVKPGTTKPVTGS